MTACQKLRLFELLSECLPRSSIRQIRVLLDLWKRFQIGNDEFEALVTELVPLACMCGVIDAVTPRVWREELKKSTRRRRSWRGSRRRGGARERRPPCPGRTCTFRRAPWCPRTDPLQNSFEAHYAGRTEAARRELTSVLPGRDFSALFFHDRCKSP